MKKAKLLLTAIAILGIAGGAFAFKIRSMYGSILYTAPSNCALGTKTATATTTNTGTQKVYVTWIYGTPACFYTYTIFKQ